MSSTTASKSQKYRVVAMGGTFDVLHRGHRKLLKQAFEVGRTVMIGITTDQFAKSLHKPHRFDSYARRKGDLERLLKRWGVLSRARIVPLKDRFGPTATSSGIQALVVSRRTIKTAYAINAKRKTNGLKPLIIDPIDLILAEDKRPISSTRIRRGRIDREGRLLG
ncbi:MAG TPA: pantetheine-phosphate adenylyltransferase [Terriglobales bacterium]|nr:pantetheine-phosphate adenylyltransferase [Terriglobales bacterium]